MKTSSAKAKGKRCAAEVRELLLKYGDEIADTDVSVTPSSVPGTDIKLSMRAMSEFPFAIECKNQEKLNIWSAIEQAQSNCASNLMPIVFFKRNKSELYAVMKAVDLMKLKKHWEFLMQEHMINHSIQVIEVANEEDEDGEDKKGGSSSIQ